MKASDNIFPKLILDGVTTAPSAPTDDSWRLYAGMDGIYARSSNTTVGPFASSAPPASTSSLATSRARYTGGNITTSTSGTDKLAVSSTNLDVTVAAASGDVLQYSVSMMGTGNNTGELLIDGVTVVSSTFTNYVSGGSLTDGGISGLYLTPSLSTARGLSCCVQYVVQSGDISGGDVTIRLVYKPAANAKTLYATTTYPIHVAVANLGQ